MAKGQHREPRRQEGFAAWSTLVITNSIKLCGLVFAVRELAGARDPYVIGACIVMMSGVQGLEDALVRVAERFFSPGS